MTTYDLSYEILRDLQILDEPIERLSREDNLQMLRHDIRKHIQNAYEKNQNQYNLRTRVATFNIGQEVYRRNFVQNNVENGFNAKLSTIFIKARIRERLGQH